MQRLHSPREEAAFEIGEDDSQFGGSFHSGKSSVLSESIVHLAEVIEVICPKIDCSARFESFGAGFNKAAFDQAVFELFALWPWIRKIDVQSGDGLRREQVLDEISCF